MPEPARVSITVAGGVADVRLNRPDKMNALDQPMFEALAGAAEQLGRDRAVRAVVLSGEGRGFCAGLDFGAFASMAGTGSVPERRDGSVPERRDGSVPERRDGSVPERRDGSVPERRDGSAPERGPDGGGGVTAGLGARPAGRIANLGQQAAYGWTELAVPVIAAVHGVALGGGLQIALGADIRIVAPDAKLSVLEIRWGLIPDMTGTHMLRRLVPLDVAKELTWSGRMVEGDEAVRIGLATRVSDEPLKDALELAAELAGKSPDAIRAGKRLLNQSGLVDPAQQFLDESAEMGALIGSPNQVEAVKAYFDRREPVFADPDLG